MDQSYETALPASTGIVLTKPYYVSNRLISGGPDPSAWRLPAVRLETLVADLIADHLDAAIGEHRLLGSLKLGGQHEVTAKARRLADRVRTGERDVLRDLLASGTIGPQTLSLTLERDCLAAELGIPADDIADRIEQITSDLQLRRRGVEAKLVVGDTPAAPDAVLLRTLRDAHLWTAALRDGVSLGDIAREAGHHDVYIRTRSQLAFLSPRIQRAIADGSLAPEITLQHLMTVTLPLDWQDQERLCRLA